MKTWKIVLLCCAVLFVLVPTVVGWWAYLHFTGDDAEENARALMSRVWNASAGDDVKEQVRANEAALLESFELYREAQAVHKEQHGSYARRLEKMSLPEEFVRAQVSTRGKPGYRGYHFRWIPQDGALDTDWVTRYALCAVPETYRVTGIHTYVIDSDGLLVQKDNWGSLVANTAEVLDGSWVEVARAAPPAVRAH